jgi:hypothetical protein
MRRHVFHLMLFIALILQGVVAVGGGVSADHGQEQHCAGHDTLQKDCACCPDGAATGMSCTVQCTVAQASFGFIAPVRLASYSTSNSFSQLALASPNYVPLVPPPIA